MKKLENQQQDKVKVVYTWCLLDHDYITNHYRLIALEWSRQKELDADREAIQHIEFVG